MLPYYIGSLDSFSRVDEENTFKFEDFRIADIVLFSYSF